jgi:Domain of unknown function (DUF6457)
VNEWLTRQADALGVAQLTEAEAATLLEIARVAAHESGDRRNAPLLCYLLGRAASGAEFDALAEAIRRSSS